MKGIDDFRESMLCFGIRVAADEGNDATIAGRNPQLSTAASNSSTTETSISSNIWRRSLKCTDVIKARTIDISGRTKSIIKAISTDNWRRIFKFFDVIVSTVSIIIQLVFLSTDDSKGIIIASILIIFGFAVSFTTKLADYHNGSYPLFCKSINTQKAASIWNIIVMNNDYKRFICITFLMYAIIICLNVSSLVLSVNELTYATIGFTTFWFGTQSIVEDPVIIKMFGCNYVPVQTTPSEEMVSIICVESKKRDVNIKDVKREKFPNRLSYEFVAEGYDQEPLT